MIPDATENYNKYPLDDQQRSIEELSQFAMADR